MKFHHLISLQYRTISYLRLSFLQEIKQLKTTKVEFESRILELEDQAKHEKLAHLEEVKILLETY